MLHVLHGAATTLVVASMLHGLRGTVGTVPAAASLRGFPGIVALVAAVPLLPVPCGLSAAAASSVAEADATSAA